MHESGVFASARPPQSLPSTAPQTALNLPALAQNHATLELPSTTTALAADFSSAARKTPTYVPNTARQVAAELPSIAHTEACQAGGCSTIIAQH